MNLVSNNVSLQNRENKTFPEKQILREFVMTWPALQEMLKGVLQTEMKGHIRQ